MTLSENYQILWDGARTQFERDQAARRAFNACLSYTEDKQQTIVELEFMDGSAWKFDLPIMVTTAIRAGEKS